ncbi:MAG: caspase family protein, partial [Rhodoglobus sp.]
DGCVRLYRPDMTIAMRSQYPPVPPERECQGTESELGGIRFSPDGALVAFGLRYRVEGDRLRPEVVVMDARTPKIVRVVHPDNPHQQSLCCIAWSADSTTLFVNGDVEGDQATPVYRMIHPATGELERWDVGEEQIANMLPLPGGGMVLATTTPSIVKVDADGAVSRGPGGTPMIVRPGNIVFRAGRADPLAFKLSPDGRTVELARHGRSAIRIDTRQGDPSRFVRVDVSPRADLRPAKRAGRLRVSTQVGHFAHRSSTRIDGHGVELLRDEDVWSWAVHGRRPIAVLGTQWHVRLLDATGRPLPGWEQPPFIPAPAYHSAITDDGLRAVVALGDGTVRWYDVASARELLSVFVHDSGENWVAWLPDGHYASSPGGDQFLGWLVNRSTDGAPDFFRAAQFERTLYRSDVGRRAFDARLLAQAPGQPHLSAPRVRIESIDEQTREVRFSVDPVGQRVTEIGVYADTIPLLDAAARTALASAKPVVRTVRVPDGLAFDSIRVEAEAASALGLDEAAAVRPVLAEVRKGRLRVVVIGVGRFDDFMYCAQQADCAVRPLPNAPNDAQELATALKQQEGRAFSKVDIVQVGHGIGPTPTKRALLEALTGLDPATPEDTTIVFLASHGITGPQSSGEYYFLTSDVTAETLRAVLGPATSKDALMRATRSLLSGTELTDALRKLAGRRILLIDTCHAGAARRSSNPYALARRSASAQVALLSAARGNELSYEYFDPTVRHGAFTYALLSSLDGLDAASEERQLTLEQMHRYVTVQVKRNTERVTTNATQTPVLYATSALRKSVLAEFRGSGHERPR